MIPADARSGSTLGKYRLHEIVGRGGMGVVYRAEHVYIGREVALKILHEGYGGREESVKRFLREARAASLINHPNIVEVTDFGKGNDGTVFFVMELLIGEPLDAILAREHRLDLMRSITICNQLAAALAAAHSKGIIHRDLKPENVMLIPREGRRELVRRVSDESGAHEESEREKQFDFVKILDFGVAKVREPETQKGRVTQAGVVFGTPEYMAPETARVGFSDARSDIYALGVMFYEMITGTVPFTGEAPVDVMMKQVNERVPRMHDVTPDAEVTEDAERMILKALAKDPNHRQQSMEEFHRDLQKCYGQLRFRRTVRTPTVLTPPTPTIPLTKKKLRQSQPGPDDVTPRVTASGLIAIEIDSEASRPRLTTPRLPGLPTNLGSPILLTKKKLRPSLEGSSLNGQPPDAVAPQPTPAPESAPQRAASANRPEAQTNIDFSPEKPAGAAPERDPDATPVRKKRETLPMVVGNERTPSARLAVINSSPRTPPLPARGVQIGKGGISAPPRPRDAGADAGKIVDDPPTPRATVTPADIKDRRWLDVPTVPALKINRS
jgi:serine/threonine protein kinase